MNKEKQIASIKEFIFSNEENMIINQVNDEITIFYLSVINYYANKNGVKIKNDLTNTTASENDLFGTQTIQIFNITNTKKIDGIINTHSKKIIFTDYKNYKKFNSKFNCINGYQFENDISFFIRSEMNINNDELLFYCQNNTALLFSEISKYLINSNQYSSGRSLLDDKNHILNIRKSIFEIKRNNINIKKLYQNIKNEAEYKKFSFLTY